MQVRVQSKNMKTAISNRGPGARFGLIAFLAAMVALPVARSQDTPYTQGAIPLIVMDDVPLRDAIRNLARQAGQNYIFGLFRNVPAVFHWAG